MPTSASDLGRVCSKLGVPMAAQREGPTTHLTILGIEIDTVKGELQLPKDKLVRLTALSAQWKNKRSCSVRKIQSLIGHLNLACKVVQVQVDPS